MYWINFPVNFGSETILIYISFTFQLLNLNIGSPVISDFLFIIVLSKFMSSCAKFMPSDNICTLEFILPLSDDRSEEDYMIMHLELASCYVFEEKWDYERMSKLRQRESWPLS